MSADCSVNFLCICNTYNHVNLINTTSSCVNKGEMLGCYRPQTKFWGKAIFSQASVILSTGGRGDWLPSMHHRSHDQGGLPPGGSACRGSASRWSASGGSASEGSASRGGLHLGEGLHPGESAFGKDTTAYSQQAR